MMLSQKVVIPAKAGIQRFGNSLKFRHSRLRGNDGNVGSDLLRVHRWFINNDKWEPPSIFLRKHEFPGAEQ
jgi:hypothetical protein